MEDLRDRSALVTGCGRGIGGAIAEELQRRGANVVGIDRAPPERPPPGIELLRADVRDDPDELVERIAAVHGVPELIVNNAGIDPPGGFLDADARTVEDTLSTNLRGPWFLTRSLVQQLVVGGRGGSIVFISSLHSSTPRTHAHYGASKAAVTMLVRELAHELGPHRIRVNAVSPGWVPTSGMPPELAGGQERVKRVIPLGRYGRPDDVAKIVAVLLSDQLAGYVTGADVPVDGGLATFTWCDQP